MTESADLSSSSWVFYSWPTIYTGNQFFNFNKLRKVFEIEVFHEKSLYISGIISFFNSSDTIWTWEKYHIMRPLTMKY